MKSKALFILLALGCNIAYSQTPLQKKWDYRFGGSDKEFLYSLEQTSDGGYILGGETKSDISGDISQPNHGFLGAQDYWIVKTDSMGIRQWDKRYGGDWGETSRCVHQTKDGGYIIAGSTNSDTSAGSDITQPKIGSTDWWLVKTDAMGNKVWDKRYGGLDEDYLYSVHETSDGGYILGGYTESDSTGDVSQHSKGLSDYWIVKTDSAGNKLWDKRYGGTQDDNLFSILETNDGGYILGGTSSSDSTGDVSQHNRGISDYWIVKTDALGNKQWDKRFGGSSVDYFFDLKEASGNEYILGGYSWSDSTGDVSEHSRGMSDLWMVKTDSTGNKIWDRRYGGSNEESFLGYIKITNDGGYLLSGSSYSNISGEKTEDNLGNEQSWMIKTDSSGNRQWDKTIFTNSFNSDDAGYAIENDQGCFVAANFTKAGIGGNKTQSSQGLYDYWLLKFCYPQTETSVTQISSESMLNVYPSPFTDHVTINGTHEGGEIILYDATGNEVLKQKCDNETTLIIAQNLSSGFYILQYISENKSLKFKVFKD